MYIIYIIITRKSRPVIHYRYSLPQIANFCVKAKRENCLICQQRIREIRIQAAHIAEKTIRDIRISSKVAAGATAAIGWVLTAFRKT